MPKGFKMKMTQKKANQIKGLYSTLNKIEYNNAMTEHLKGVYYENNSGYQEFTCRFRDYDFSDYTYCELTSQSLTLKEKKNVNGNKYFFGDFTFGGNKPTTQYIYDDSCSYSDFRLVVEFARKAIKAGGIQNMKGDTHQVTVEMPDYLTFEPKE